MANNLTETLDSVFDDIDFAEQSYNPPYENYNAYGQLIGYKWSYGNSVELKIHLTGEFTVANNAIIYDVHNDAPTSSTVGVINQKAYNTVDLKSWTCTTVVDSTYTWTLDSEFTYDTLSDRKIYIPADKALDDKYTIVTIYNDYGTIILQKQFPVGAVDLEIDLTPAQSEQMFPRGIYKCEVLAYTEPNSFVYTIIDSNDCIFMVE